VGILPAHLQCAYVALKQGNIHSVKAHVKLITSSDVIIKEDAMTEHQCTCASAQAMRHGALPPVMHLRDVNPYVESTLGDWGKKQGLAAGVPRQAMPAPVQSASGGDQAVGTSSFGMSGVNSHVLLRPANAGAVPSDEQLHL
jgi:hypothetical protein